MKTFRSIILMLVIISLLVVGAASPWATLG